MAIIKCSECGKEISDKATTCPNCGCPTGNHENLEKRPVVGKSNTSEGNLSSQANNKKKRKETTIVIAILVSIFTLLAIAKACGDMKTQQESTVLTDSTDVSTTNEVEETVVEEEVYDSVKVDSLKKFSRIKKDEFSNLTWYEPKACPKYRNSNGVYCYFGGNEYRATSSLRFTIQYYASDWLFIEYAIFLIDGNTYRFNHEFADRDNAGGYIWEWIDIPIESYSDKQIIEAIANAKSVKIKFIGKQYYDTRTLSATQISGIKQNFELYKAMNGDW